MLLPIHSIAYAFPFKGLDIKIKGTITEMYDDNINFTKDDKKEDFMTTFSLGFSAEYEGKRRSVRFLGDIRRSYHATFTDIKNSYENLQINFRNEFTQYDTLMLSGAFSHSEVPMSFEEEFGRVRGRHDSYVNTVRIGYNKKFSERFNSYLQYTYELNTAVEETISDSYLNMINLSVNYLHSILTTFFMSYDVSNRRFKGGGDVDIHAVSLGFRKYITRRLFFDGRTGLNLVTVDNGEGDITQTVEISLTDEIDRNTLATLSFARMDEATSEKEDIFRSWQVSANLSKEFTDKLNGSIRVFYGNGRYVTSNFKYSLLGVNVGVSYEFTEHLSGQANYTYSNFDSNTEAQGYSKNVVYSGLAMTF
jgi:hypothetical protein